MSVECAECAKSAEGAEGAKGAEGADPGVSHLLGLYLELQLLLQLFTLLRPLLLCLQMVQVQSACRSHVGRVL